MRGALRLTCSTILVLSCQWLTGPARGNTETALRLQNGDRVRASLDEPGEEDLYRFTAPADVDVRVKVGARRSGLNLDVSASDESAHVRPPRRGRRTWRIRVRHEAARTYLVGVRAGDGAGTGDYRVTVSWRSRRTVTSVVHLESGPTGDEPLGGASTDAFVGLRGEVARISVSAADGHLAEPYLKSLRTPDPGVGLWTVVPLDGATSARVPLGAAWSRYVVWVGNRAASSGDAVVRVKLRRERRRLDLRGLGGPLDTVLVANRITRRDGGTLLGDDVDEQVTLPGAPPLSSELNDLAGARVDVAPGALVRSATFVLASSPQLEPAVPGMVRAGPPLFVGPSDAASEHDAEAEILLPCDSTEPRVFARTTDGVISEIPSEAIAVNDDPWYPSRSVRFRARVPAAFQAFVQRERYSFRTVAASDDRIVVGVPGELVDGTWNAGTIYVYVHADQAWVEEARILPEEPLDNGAFGNAIALDGDTLVVRDGARIAVLVRDPADGWVRQDELRTSDGTLLNPFRFAIDGDTIVAGVPFVAFEDRAAHVFVRLGTEWVEEQKISAPDAFASSAFFGWAVDVSGDRIVVGALEGGLAWAYRRSEDEWALDGQLLRTEFAGVTSAVSIDDDTAVVGTTFSENVGFSIGEVSVFRRSDGEWRESAQIPRPADLPNARDLAFGKSLDLRGGRLVVGAPKDTSWTTLVGRAYVFDDNGATFDLVATLSPESGQSPPVLGASVALSPDGTTAILGVDGADVEGTDPPGSLVFDIDAASRSE